MLSGVNLDLLAIATPLRGRAELVQQALLSGKHVFTEKPLAESYGRALELVKLARSRDLCLFTNYVHAYSSGLEHVLRSRPEIGQLDMIDVRLEQPGPIYRSEGAMSLLGSHALAIIIRMAGREHEPARLENVRYRELANGKLVTIQGRFGDAGPEVRFTVNIGHPIRSRAVDMVGSRGLISVVMTGDSGVWHSRYPEAYQADNVSPDVSDRRFDERHNLHRVLDRCIGALEGRHPDNTQLALSVQQILEQCQV